MKKTFITAIILVLAISLASCDFSDPFKQTDELVLYNNGLYTHVFETALRIFKDNYPEVKVTVVENNIMDIYLELDAFRDKYHAELMTGNGPDVILATRNVEFTNIEKIYNSGIFFDMNQYISTMPDEYLDTLNTNMADVGIYKGKRLLFPIFYCVDFMLTTENTLKMHNINLNVDSTFDEYSKQIIDFCKTHEDSQDISLLCRMGNTGLLTDLSVSGLILVDYDTQSVTIDEENLKIFMDYVKAIWKKTENDYGKDRRADGYAGIILGNTLFSAETADLAALVDNIHTLTSSNDEIPVLLTIPSVYDAPVAQIELCAGIRSSSPNKLNAYRFIQILLSDEVQLAGMPYIYKGGPTWNGLISVKPEIVERALATAAASIDMERIMIQLPQRAYTPAVLKAYADAALRAKPALMSNAYLDGVIYTNHILPYLEEKISYEKFVEGLERWLNYYITE